MSEDADARPRRSKAALWLILALCVAPMIGSYVAYYVWQPSGHVNYGDLIEPRPLPDVELTLLDGHSTRVAALKGDWILLVADAAACDERCRKKLAYTRQVRLAEGREKTRIERMWLIVDGGTPDAALVAEHPGLLLVRGGAIEISKALPAAGSPAEHIYVVDPLGNVMMRFPSEPDPRKILKDMSRLLRHSKWK